MWHKIKTPAEKASFKYINTWKITEDSLVVCEMNGKYYFKIMMLDLDRDIKDGIIWEINGSNNTPISAFTHYELWMSLPRAQTLV